MTGPSGTYYGIPIGSKQNNTDPSGSADSYFKDMLIDNEGTQFYRILIRIACAHLMGQPFSQAFIREDTVKSDLENCDLSAQIIDSLSLNDMTQIDGPSGEVVDISLGTQNNVLQTIYEQLLRVNNFDMGREPDQSGNDKGILRELVFRPGNIVTFYIRPRMFFVIDTGLGSANVSKVLGNDLSIKDSSSTTMNVNQEQTEAEKLFNSLFSTNGSSANPIGYKWLAGRGTPEGSAELNQWQTNLTRSDILTQLNSKGAAGMFDGHIWKVEVQL